MLKLQYCVKEMQTKFGVFRSLFSRKFDEISPRNFVKALANFRLAKRNFALILLKFRIHWSERHFRFAENSHPRNFAIAKIRTCEISPGRKFELAKFPQSEISLAMETVCNDRIVVSSSTQTRPTSTHIVWRLKWNFLKLLNLSGKKIKVLFTGLGRSVLG